MEIITLAPFSFPFPLNITKSLVVFETSILTHSRTVSFEHSWNFLTWPFLKGQFIATPLFFNKRIPLDVLSSLTKARLKVPSNWYPGLSAAFLDEVLSVSHSNRISYTLRLQKQQPMCFCCHYVWLSSGQSKTVPTSTTAFKWS